MQVLTKVHTERDDQVDGQNHFINSGIYIADILKNDSILSCFMEFMDSSPTFSPGQSLIEFWLCATNFRYLYGSEVFRVKFRPVLKSYISLLTSIFRDVVKESQENTKEARQNTLDDAVGIYNKFVSMEAITPLGFSSIVRSV